MTHIKCGQHKFEFRPFYALQYGVGFNGRCLVLLVAVVRRGGGRRPPTLSRDITDDIDWTIFHKTRNLWRKSSTSRNFRSAIFTQCFYFCYFTTYSDQNKVRLILNENGFNHFYRLKLFKIFRYTVQRYVGTFLNSLRCVNHRSIFDTFSAL